MNVINQAFNHSPCYTDWRRYDSPTVLRRLGRGFLNRTWKPDPLGQEQYPLSKPELETLLASYGVLCLPSADQTVRLFADYHWADLVHHLLNKRGVSATHFGCYIQLQGRWR